MKTVVKDLLSMLDELAEVVHLRNFLVCHYDPVLMTRPAKKPPKKIAPEPKPAGRGARVGTRGHPPTY